MQNEKPSTGPTGNRFDRPDSLFLVPLRLIVGRRALKVRRHILLAVCVSLLGVLAASAASFPTARVTLHINTTSHEFKIPPGFVGLGFETASELPNHYGVSGYFFTPKNAELITLFKNIGVRTIRVGGDTVDTHGRKLCDVPIPTDADIDHLFKFAQAAGVKVIYSLRLLNPKACSIPDLPAVDARMARYIWRHYRANLNSFAIGNEPDVRGYHTYPGHVVDPMISDSVPGIPGSAYPSYLADWRRVAQAILKAVPAAKFSGPDTAVSRRGTYTPNPSTGMSWTEAFARDEMNSEHLAAATQHEYIWGRPGNTTARQEINNMLSLAWDNDTSIGTEPAGNKMKTFTPYPYLYNHNLCPIVRLGIPYRMTEANDCLHGVDGASNGFASALWALDFMHWWAAHHLASVHFHNNPWIPTDTIVPDPNPCPATDCGNYRVTPKGYGMKAFGLGSHGYVEPVKISNQRKVNLTAYAVGDAHNLYVTVINRTHFSTHDATVAKVTIRPRHFKAVGASWILLTDGKPGNAALMTATLGGAPITNHSRWVGTWTPIHAGKHGKVTLTVQPTTAVIVRIQAVDK